MQTLGSYDVIDVLGRGGMGVVYRGQDPQQRAVALKTVEARDRRHIDSIRREIHALRRIEHPGVVQIVDDGVVKGKPWYAMELMEGVTLRGRFSAIWSIAGFGDDASEDLMGTTRASWDLPVSADDATVELPPDARHLELTRARPANGELTLLLNLIARLCRTLAFVHGHGIVHGDLKPANIFLKNDAHPVLVDFGLSTSFGSPRGREVLELSQSRAGTVAYMSPEQIRGELLDARSDLYALGVILFEGLTGRLPFPQSPLATLGQHLNASPPDPADLVEDAPEGLCALILDLLAKQPSDRPGHADDVAARLVELGADDAILNEGPPPRPYLYRPGFVGRRSEVRRMLRRLPSGRRTGGLVFIGGESGVGKTRFAIEMTRRIRASDMDVITSQCVPPQEGASSAVRQPLHPLKPLLVAATDRCIEGGAEATELLFGRRALRLSAYHPVILHAPGVGAFRAESTVPDDVAQRQLFVDLKETLRAYASDRTLVLVIDDLQWSDELTLAFLHNLSPPWLRRQNIFIICTYRTDEANPEIREMAGSPKTIDIELGRLESDAIEEMIGDMLGAREVPSAFVDFLSRFSEGNPFFVTEYLRTAVAEELVERDAHGRWLLSRGREGGFDLLELPRGVRALVARRLSGLPPQAQRLAECASVIGREFEPRVLRDASGLSGEGWLDALDHLIFTQVLEETPTQMLRFVHDKLREGAYERLSAERRAALHRDVAETLEAQVQEPEQLALLHPALARHWSAAGDTRRAVHHLEQAGRWATDNAAYRDAIGFLEDALARTESEGATSRRAGWCRLIGRASFATGDLESAERYCRQALDMMGYAVPQSEMSWKLLLVRQIGRQALHLANLKDLVPHRRGSSTSAAHASLAASVLAERFFFESEALQMFTMALLSINLGERTSPSPRMINPYTWLGYVMATAKLGALSDRYFGLAEELAARFEDPSGVAQVQGMRALHLLGHGEWDNASEHLGRALELIDQETDPQSWELFQNGLAHIAFYTGDLHRSLSIYQEILASADERDNAQHTAWALFTSARSELLLGRHDSALAHLRRSRHILDDLADSASEIICEGLMAWTLLTAGDPTGASDASERALALIEDASPTAFTTIDGYEGVAEVLLWQWSNAGAGSRPPRRVKVMEKAFSRLSSSFPVTRPASSLFSGRVHHLAGSPRKAARCFEACIDEARQLKLPLHEARAALALAETGWVSQARQRQLVREANAALEALGCAETLSAPLT